MKNYFLIFLLGLVIPLSCQKVDVPGYGTDSESEGQGVNPDKPAELTLIDILSSHKWEFICNDGRLQNDWLIQCDKTVLLFNSGNLGVAQYFVMNQDGSFDDRVLSWDIFEYSISENNIKIKFLEGKEGFLFFKDNILNRHEANYPFYSSSLSDKDKRYVYSLDKKLSGECGSGVTWEYAFPELKIKTAGVAEYSMMDYGKDKAPWNLLLVNSVNMDGAAFLDHIGNYAFSGLDVGSLELPYSVTSIGEGAFENCRYLSSVKFKCSPYQEAEFETNPNPIRKIGKYAFRGCRISDFGHNDKQYGYVPNLNFPLLEEIGDEAIEGVYYGIFIGNHIRSIGKEAFRTVPSRDAVTLYLNQYEMPQTGGNIFVKDKNVAWTLKVPASSVGIYKTGGDWALFDSVKTLSYRDNTRMEMRRDFYAQNLYWIYSNESWVNGLIIDSPMPDKYAGWEIAFLPKLGRHFIYAAKTNSGAICRTEFQSIQDYKNATGLRALEDLIPKDVFVEDTPGVSVDLGSSTIETAKNNNFTVRYVMIYRNRENKYFLFFISDYSFNYDSYSFKMNFEPLETAFDRVKFD